MLLDFKVFGSRLWLLLILFYTTIFVAQDTSRVLVNSVFTSPVFSAPVKALLAIRPGTMRAMRL